MARSKKAGRNRLGQFTKGSAAARAAGRKGACSVCKGKKRSTRRKRR